MVLKVHGISSHLAHPWLLGYQPHRFMDGDLRQYLGIRPGLNAR